MIDMNANNDARASESVVEELVERADVRHERGKEAINL